MLDTLPPHWYALNIAGCTEIISRQPVQVRRRVLARGEVRPDYVKGAALLADYLVLSTARRVIEALVSIDARSSFASQCDDPRAATDTDIDV
jgi:hypothetical protein